MTDIPAMNPGHCQRYINFLLPEVHVTLLADVENEPRTSRPDVLAGAVALYGTLLLVAAIWGVVRGLDFSFVGADPLRSIALGLSGAVVLLVFGWLGTALVPLARRLSEEMAGILVDGTGAAGLLLLAVLSGVCEEVFFRGVLQQEFGLVAASVVFGLAHFVPGRRFAIWTAYAVVAGFFLGWLYDFTYGLAAPVMAHVLNNFVVLVYWRRRLRRSSG